MPRAIRMGLVLAAVGLCSTPLAAGPDDSGAADRSTSTLPSDTPPEFFAPQVMTLDPSSGPFLLDVPPAPDSAATRSAGRPEAGDGRVVVCGMTIVPADSDVDPAMRVDPPGGETLFTLRTVQPPVCGPE